MKFWLFILSFLILYIAGGRKIAVPYGVAFPNNLFQTIILTTMFDFLQIPLFYFIYRKSDKGLGILKKLKFVHKKRKPKIFRWAKKFGVAGVFILAALPSFGGGIWTSVLLAFLLRIDKKVSYLLIMLGSLIGITFLAFLSHGIIQSIISLIH